MRLSGMGMPIGHLGPIPNHFESTRNYRKGTCMKLHIGALPLLLAGVGFAFTGCSVLSSPLEGPRDSPASAGQPSEGQTHPPESPRSPETRLSVLDSQPSIVWTFDPADVPGCNGSGQIRPDAALVTEDVVILGCSDGVYGFSIGADSPTWHNDTLKNVSECYPLTSERISCFSDGSIVVLSVLDGSKI